MFTYGNPSSATLTVCLWVVYIASLSLGFHHNGLILLRREEDGHWKHLAHGGTGPLIRLQFLCSLLPRDQLAWPGTALPLASAAGHRCSSCDLEETGRGPLVSVGEEASSHGMAHLGCIEGMEGCAEVGR